MEASPNRVVRPRRSCPRVLRASPSSSSAAAVIVVLALAACSPPPTPPTGFEPVTARFDADTEGWASAEGQAPTWQAPGYLSVADEGAGWQYAIAPAAFHGDWTGAETLSFRVLVDDGLIEHPLRVMISGPDHALYVAFPLDDLVSGEWVAFSV